MRFLFRWGALIKHGSSKQVDDVMCVKVTGAGEGGAGARAVLAQHREGGPWSHALKERRAGLRPSSWGGAFVGGHRGHRRPLKGRSRRVLGPRGEGDCSHEGQEVLSGPRATVANATEQAPPTTNVHFLTVLEARSPSSRYPVELVSSEVPLLGLWTAACLLRLHMVLPL